MVRRPLRSAFDTEEEYLQALAYYDEEMSSREMEAEERYYENKQHQ